MFNKPFLKYIEAYLASNAIRICVYTDQNEIVAVEGDTNPKFVPLTTTVIDECNKLRGKPDKIVLKLKTKFGTITRIHDMAEGEELLPVIDLMIPNAVKAMEHHSI